ncbi:MAG: hypothetical protein U0990_04940 [Candidatus Nanopelagicales bacterium]|nr:hypothetical protein [Candidatus Nanopelagicales bacterium]MDZ4249419.1 hypothetical protein [Candidatus Nanopelagicales bacterium]
MMLVLNFLYNMVLGGMFTASTSYTYDPTTGAYVYSTGGIPGGFIVSMVLYEIVAVVLSWIFQAQFVRAGLENTKAGRISLDIFFKTALLGAVVLGALIVSALTLVGFILCIVPGLVFGFFAQFFQYFILDQGQSPLTAIKSSLSFVSGNLANVFLLSIASIVAVVIGALLCGVGLLIAIPVVVLAQAYTYRVLSGQPVAA